ncbi:MAG: DUF4231 domain-containing protein [Candidatus Acidiferrales bacterium]
MPKPAKAVASADRGSVAVEAHRHVPTEDMDDTVELNDYDGRIKGGHAEYAPLHNALALLQNTIHAPFRRCDREAIYYQKCYQWTAIFAVGFGALTILLAILEFIVKPPEPAVLTWSEPVTAGLALVLIAVGSFGKFKEKWLTARYKAENLRLLKFRKLTDSRLWCPPIDVGLLAEELQDEVRQLEAQNYEEAKEWASHGVHPGICGPPCVDTCDEALHELIEYYRPKRLHVQMRYLARKSKADEQSGSWTATLVQTIFFASFAFVLAHVAVHIAGAGAGEETAPSLSEQVLIGLAAGVPVVAAGFRTYRASREFERNALRHRATLDSLETLEYQLRDTKHLADKFRLLGFCELVLEADCRDFMRLLCEVEWYG